jgi:hypothetical protein
MAGGNAAKGEANDPGAGLSEADGPSLVPKSSCEGEPTSGSESNCCDLSSAKGGALKGLPMELVGETPDAAPAKAEAAKALLGATVGGWKGDASGGVEAKGDAPL